MTTALHRTPFYFLRHGETDHNAHQIYDDVTQVQLNEKGHQQALHIQRVLHTLPLSTVCSSPLLRVQQTKNIVIQNKPVRDIICEEFSECPGSLWRLFIAAETTNLTVEEWSLINTFTSRVQQGLSKALQYPGPILIVAHGGTYWALAHLLQLQGDRKIGNCILTYISPVAPNLWRAEPICME